MQRTTLHLHTALRIGRVDPRIFGGFLEHMGRAVYEGVYQPESPHADSDGWRSDVLEALQGLDMTVMRYPGGNFASGYHWEDGVGPPEGRPTVRELAWQSIEPNQVGTDEFMALCRRMNWTPMLSVNLGTGTPEEARNWVEYCNAPKGTRYADLRSANGTSEPYAVPLWCLGNEMDGPWQLGHVPAQEYAIRAQQAGKMMKDVDPNIELVVCGSSGLLMPTWLEWDRTVLEHVGGLADYVSLHRYEDNRPDDTPDFLASTRTLDRQIEEVDAVCRAVAGKRRSRRRPYLSFDEWNVWYKTWSKEHMNGQGRFAPPLIEEVYNLEDALVVAGFLQSFVRHADCVKVANLAQIVNVIAPILTRADGLLVQSIYWPFAMVSRRRAGESLRVGLEGPSYVGERHGEVNVVDASAILDGERLSVFLTNRSVDESSEVEIAPADRAVARLSDAELLSGPGAKVGNSFEAPDVIRAVAFDDVRIERGAATVELPPLSFLAATFALD